MRLSYRYVIFGVGIVLLLFPVVAMGCGSPLQLPGTVSSTGEKANNQIPKDFAEFEVGPLTVVRNGVSIGETATVSATVTNTGGIQGTYVALLKVDGQLAGQKDVMIGPGGTETFSFQVVKNEPGSYKLAIGDSTTTLNVYKWPYTIQYDLGNAYGESISVAGDYGHLVHFTPPTTPFKMQKIHIYISGLVGKDTEWDSKFVTIRIWNNGRTQQLWSVDLPWREFSIDVGSYWKEVEVPSVRADGDFFVEIVTHSAQFGGDIATSEWSPEVHPAIFIGYDKPNPYQTSTISLTETRSGISNMGQPVDVPLKYQGLNWLIRVEGDGSI